MEYMHWRWSLMSSTIMYVKLQRLFHYRNNHSIYLHRLIALMFNKKIINELMKWYWNIQWKPAAKGCGSNPCNLVCKYQQVMKMTCTITEPDLKHDKLIQPKLFSRSLSFVSKWAKDSIGCSCHGDLPQKGIIRPRGFLKWRNVLQIRITSMCVIVNIFVVSTTIVVVLHETLQHQK